MSTVNVRLLLAFFAIYVVWGSTYLAIQVAVETIPPLATAGVRHLVAGIDLYAWARAWRAVSDITRMVKSPRSSPCCSS